MINGSEYEDFLIIKERKSLKNKLFTCFFDELLDLLSTGCHSLRIMDLCILQKF